MSNKVSVQGDPYWAKAAENVAGLFNPEAEAKGASVLSTARYNNARAAGQESRNKALTYEALKAAGYSDLEIGAMQAAQDDSVASIFKGINENRGREAIIAGNPNVALPLLGQASALDDYTKGDMVRRLTTNADGSLNATIAAALAGGSSSSGGVLSQLGADGNYKIVDTTPAGKVDLNRITTDTAESNAKIKLLGTKETNLGKLTDAQVALLRQKGVAVEYLTEAKVGSIESGAQDSRTLTGEKVNTEKAKQGAITGESNARIARTNAAVNNDKVRTEAAVASSNDPVKVAQAQANLRTSINNHYAKDFSENVGANTWEQVDPAQREKLTTRALKYIVEEKLDFGTAIEKANAYYGLTGKMVKGEKGGWLFGLNKKPDGKISFDGFTEPSELADAVTGGSGSSTPPAAPAIKPAEEKKPAAPAATAPAPKAAAKKESVPAGDIDVSTNTYARNLGIKPEDLSKYAKAAGVTVKEYHDKMKANPAALEALKKAANPPVKPAAKPAAKPAPAAAKPAAQPVRIKTKEERDALPAGTVYVAPDGKTYTKK